MSSLSAVAPCCLGVAGLGDGVAGMGSKGLAASMGLSSGAGYDISKYLGSALHSRRKGRTHWQLRACFQRTGAVRSSTLPISAAMDGGAGPLVSLAALCCRLMRPILLSGSTVMVSQPVRILLVRIHPLSRCFTSRFVMFPVSGYFTKARAIRVRGARRSTSMQVAMFVKAKFM